MTNDYDIDKQLNIKTSGRDDSNSNFTNYPYEPCSYEALKIIIETTYITKKDTVLDYGSGKGRVSFYISYFTKASSIGIEYDKRLYDSSVKNLNNFVANRNISFINTCASKYQLDSNINKIVFFNPFSTYILKKVLKNVFSSLELNKREIMLFFYYISDEYKDLLNRYDCIYHLETIHLSNNNSNDYRESVYIYKII
ncbi:MAG: rRNA adenine N-6-methyltransferase family protein [Anaeroplasmataceae bacterium]